LFAILLIIHSCKKDNKTQTVANPVLNQAKEWYESTYPVIGGTSRALLSQSIRQEPGYSIDFTQYINPDWQHASLYSRLGKSVIEMPIKSAAPLMADAKAAITSSPAYNKNNSKASFLLLNDGKNYKAYVMTIMADSDYLKNNHSKLANNTYRHIDRGFSGILIYSTPNGQVLSGWRYKGGKITNIISAPRTGTTRTLMKTGGTSFYQKTRDIITCTDWYEDWYYGDEFIGSIYLYTTCTDDSEQSLEPPGDGGGPPPDGGPAIPAVLDTVYSPCGQMGHADSLAQKSVNSNIYSQLIKDTYTGHEYGDEQNLETWPPDGNIINTAIRTDFADTYFTPNFTWDSVNGYTINISHAHPAGDAPSPADVFQLIINMNNTNFKLAGAAAANYYKNNASITTVTTAGTYVVTIANFDALQSLANQYNNDPAAFNQNYTNVANANGFSTEYALLSIFGSAINVFKASPNSSTFLNMSFDANGDIQLTNCP